jgi:hypothetical protein
MTGRLASNTYRRALRPGWLGPSQLAIAGGDEVLEFAFDLPRAAVSCLELIPQPQCADR